MAPQRIADVLIPLALDTAYSYAVPEARALAEAASVSAGVIDALVDEGVLETVALAPEPVAETPDPDHARAALSADQRRAAEVLAAAVATAGRTAASVGEPAV